MKVVVLSQGALMVVEGLPLVVAAIQNKDCEVQLVSFSTQSLSSQDFPRSNLYPSNPSAKVLLVG